MPKQLVPHTAKFTLILDRGGDYEVDNTIYVRNTLAGWSSARLVTMAEGIRDWWDDECKPLVNAAYELHTIEYEDLGADPGVTGFISPAIDGTRAGNITIGIGSLLVRFIGDAGALPRKGGNYFVGGSENDIDGTTWSNEYSDLVEAAYSALPGAIASTLLGSALVIVSRFLDSEQRAEGVTNTIQDFQVRTTVSPQKRRRKKSSNYRT